MECEIIVGTYEELVLGYYFFLENKVWSMLECVIRNALLYFATNRSSCKLIFFLHRRLADWNPALQITVTEEAFEL